MIFAGGRPMAENNAKVRTPIERSAHSQPQRGCRGVTVPSPAEGGQGEIGDWFETSV